MGASGSSPSMKLGQEDREKIKQLEWCHHIQLGDVRTPGGWEKIHQDKIEACLPKDFAGKRVLDIGFNDGFYSFLAEERGAKRVIGLEIKYPETARLAKRIKGSEVEFIEEDMFFFEPHEQFDIVLYLGVYYHVVDILESFKKVFEFTAPGGEVYVEGSMYMGRWNRVLTLPPLLRLSKTPHPPPNTNFWRPTVSALRLIMEFVGFHDVKVLTYIGSRVVMGAKKNG